MDKRTVSAVFLIIMVIMAYQLLVLPRVSPPPPIQQPATQPLAPAPPAPPAPMATPSLAPAPEGSAPQSLSGELEPPPALTVVDRREIPVLRPLYKAVVDNLRGGITSWRLRDYPYGKKTPEAAGEPVEILLPGHGAGALGITFTDPLSESSFSTPLTVEEDGEILVLQGVDQYGLVMRRTYRFNPESYDVELEIRFENHSESVRNLSWEVYLGPGLDRYRMEGGGPDRPEAVAFAGDKIDKVKVKSPGQSVVVGTPAWMGIRDRYFLAAIAPLEGGLTGFARKTAESQLEIGFRAEPTTLVPRQVTSYRLLCYLGPKEQGRLTGYGIGLDKSINYGWFSWLALPLLTILNFFYSYLRNWGLAILALTLVVKLALFPITQGMYRSMRKMQSLQPQIQALKKKYKDDSKALQSATMALYKEYKVNPMAGCLPMVVQIPVFFALYRVLYNAIELRGASFLYIPDLSQKDPYYITPLLMGATMILQQRLSPTSADPKQAKMMMFMPIIFTAMFLNFSSGLVLYFLFSNIFAIGEQTLVRKWSSRGEAKPAVIKEVAPRKAGKKKKR
jgi:YidC/Oxa1 family membrane protein insertase